MERIFGLDIMIDLMMNDPIWTRDNRVIDNRGADNFAARHIIISEFNSICASYRDG